MNISSRLKSVADYISPDNKIIDVGCDHALLDIYLASKLDNIIYVSDISENALNSAITNINKYDLQKKIIPLLGDGIKMINKIDVNTLVISGMGTATIIDILSNKNIKKIKTCIFQSNNNHDLLRKYMIEHGFKLINEDVIYEDNHYYITMKYIRGKSHLSNSQIKYGIHNNKEYYYYLIDKEKDILKQIPLHRIFLRKKHYNNIKMIHNNIIKNVKSIKVK